MTDTQTREPGLGKEGLLWEIYGGTRMKNKPGMGASVSSVLSHAHTGASLYLKALAQPTKGPKQASDPFSQWPLLGSRGSLASTRMASSKTPPGFCRPPLCSVGAIY